MDEQRPWDEMIESHVREGQQYAAQGLHTAAEAQLTLAFEVLVRSYQRAVLGFCRHMLRERPDQVEDIAQEVFLAIWKTLPRFRHEARIRTWVFTIARYHCLDAWRQRTHHDSAAAPGEGYVQATPEAIPPLHAQYEHQEFLAWVRRALAQLPSADREVLALTYIAELPPAEIARVLGIAEASVRTRRKRALDRLREIVVHEQQ